MLDLEIEQRFHLLQKEIENTDSLAHNAERNLVAAIDALRIDVEILKHFMTRYHSDFTRLYPSLKEEAMQEINPEWPEVRLNDTDEKQTAKVSETRLSETKQSS
jgi:hypothetical protein